MTNMANSSCFNASCNGTLLARPTLIIRIPSRSLVVVQSLVFFLILVIGTVGNILVLAVEKSKQKKKWNSNDIFIINLALSDLSSLFVSVPLHANRLLYVKFWRTHSLFCCAVVRPLGTMTFCASIFTITTMAIYRCRVVVNPFKRKMKIRYALLCNAVIWVAAFLATLPAILVARVTKQGHCKGNWPSNKHKQLYILALLLLKFIVPLCIIAVAYLRMGFYVVQSRQRVSKSTSALRRSTNMGPRNKRENYQIVKTLSVMVVLFAVCTGPHQIAWMLRYYGDKNAKILAIVIYKFSPILNSFHSCVNPIIFGALTKKYRSGYIKYMAYICCCLRSFSFCRKVIGDFSSSTLNDEKSPKTFKKTCKQALRRTNATQLAEPDQTKHRTDVNRVSKVCFDDTRSSNGTNDSVFFGELRVENEQSIMSSQEELFIGGEMPD